MIKVLFICHGNICRSPMAEFVMKDIVNKQGLSESFHIESGATSTEEIWHGVGNPVYPPAREKLRQQGIGTKENELGVGQKRARQTTKADYDRFDFIIGMDSANMRNMSRIYGGDSDGKLYKMLDFADISEKRHGMDVADPWYTGNFDATWEDVSLGCHGLFRYILTQPEYVQQLDSEEKNYSANAKESGYDSEIESYKDDSVLIHDDFPKG